MVTTEKIISCNSGEQWNIRPVDDLNELRYIIFECNQHQLKISYLELSEALGVRRKKHIECGQLDNYRTDREAKIYIKTRVFNWLKEIGHPEPEVIWSARW